MNCDIVIVGGSVAAFAAALSAASENASVCLLEPTDWLGGQMTSAGVPALDFAPEGYPTAWGQTDDTLAENMPKSFVELLSKLRCPNFDTCWVSPYCFLPTSILAEVLGPAAAAAAPLLRIFFETVPTNTSLRADGTTITSVEAVQRTARASTPCGGYDLPPSQTIEDWYVKEDSPRFTKTTLRLSASVFIDASYSGDLLALSGAPFLQGADEKFDGDVSGDIGDGTLGQATIMTLQIAMDAEPVSPPESPSSEVPWAEWGSQPFKSADDLYWDKFNLTFPEFWTRRRSYASAFTSDPDFTSNAIAARRERSHTGNFHPPPVNIVSPGDVTLMVWHDYYWSFLWLSKMQTRSQVSKGWRGGYNIHTLRGAETYAALAYEHFKDKAPEFYRLRMRRDSTHLGTCTGLAKMPYVRDGRRSIGLGDFTMNLSAKAIVHGTPTATAWSDRVGIAKHGLDMWGHRMMPLTDSYPTYIKTVSAWCNTGHYTNVSTCTPGEKIGCPCVPAFVPFRTLTNAKVRNLVVAGLAMAQSYMVNSALRMHPIEWSTGTSAGVVAAFMKANGIMDTALLESEERMMAMQAALRRHVPLEWTINGKRWPPLKTDDRSFTPVGTRGGVSNVTFHRMSGVTFATNTNKSLYISGISINRLELDWAILEPFAPNDPRYKYNTEAMEHYKARVLEQNVNGVQMLTLLGYASPWSAVNQTIGGGHPLKIDAAHVADWVRYVERVVSALVKPPYSVRFFQIWNEASDWAWPGDDKDMSEYLTRVHIPAARKIRELGGKVVYGGWPSSHDMHNFFSVLDLEPQSWNLTDVLDCHYQTGWNSAWAYDLMRTAAEVRGVKPLGLWQSELGNSVDPAFFASIYPKILYWWAMHEPDNPDFAKVCPREFSPIACAQLAGLTKMFDIRPSISWRTTHPPIPLILTSIRPCTDTAKRPIPRTRAQSQSVAWA
jgi:hypothetical protein